MKKTWLSALVVAMLLAVPGFCPAQEVKPVVTVAFSGYDEVMADIAFLGQISENPELREGLEGMLEMMTGGRGLAGLDKAKPWGGVVTLGEDMQPSGYAFLPVTDLAALLETLTVGGIESEDLGDGFRELTGPDQTLIVKLQGGWAFVGPTKESLAGLPADPAALLGDLPKKYDVAVRASVQNVPPPLRDLFIAQLRIGAAAGMERLPGETDEQYAARAGMTKKMIEQFVTVVNDLDEVVVGVAIDRETRSAYLDVQVTAVAGSETAAAMSQAPTTTRFAGFSQPGAAMTMHVASALADSDVAQAKAAIDTLRTSALQELKQQGLKPNELQVATRVITDVLDVLEKTVDARKSDGGAVLILEPSAVSFAAGMAVADGDKLEGAVKALVAQILQEQPDLAPLVRLDAETHQGVRFHQVAVPLPDDEESAPIKAMVGDTLEVVVGIGPDSAYVSGGRDAAGLLKKVIDASQAAPAQTVPAMELKIALTPILRFVAAMADDPQMAPIIEAIGAAAAEPAGKDHVTVVSRTAPNGAVVRLEIEEGALKIIPMIGEMIGGMAGGLDFPLEEGDFEMEMEEDASPF